MKKLLVPLFISLATINSYGSFSIVLDAGQLRADSSMGMPMDGLLILVTAGSDGIFQTPTSLIPGSYSAGDDVLLSVMGDTQSAQGFNTAGGTNETNNTFVINTAAPPSGQEIGLLWFGGITYTQWLAGTTPTAGMTFGFYNPKFWGNATDNPDPGDPWVVPSAGSLVNLDFYTTDSSGGGSQLPSRGFGNNFSVVPEPSSLALIGFGLFGLVPILRRRKA